MSKIGTIGWIDLTVPDADSVRDFYRDVVGWTTTDIDMGGYADYVMVPPETSDGVAGVCHARGSNTGLPAQWLIYVTVANLDRSIEAANARGGSVVYGPRDMGEYGRMCVIRDPAGAVAGLIEPKAT